MTDIQTKNYVEGDVNGGNVAGHDINIVSGTQIINYYSETANQEIQVLVNIRHLPEPTTALIGRQTELTQLTEAIKNPNKRLAIIVAAGGIGKSALTDEWLQQIAQENYYGKTRVFGWSFYSQGSHNTFTNSQPFFSAMLPFLGISEIPKDEIEKARLLARCLQQQPCLLILDGLEPLQYSENLQSMNGELQDSALKEFIACFRQTAGKSFVLLSSRQPLVELKKWQAEHYLSLDLKTLPHEDGADLLKALGVMGKVAERQAISKDLNGHALSLVLFGHLLSEHHQGDCRYAKELPPLTSAHGDSDAEKDSRHALRVLDYYDSLQDAASRCFLQLLGLFDRPMNAAEKAVLIANANRAEPLRALTDSEWKKVEQRLEKSGLLLGKKGSFERLEWDTHPIIRSFFGEKFKENYPEDFKQAHFVLFEYFQKLPEKEFPDTLEEMLPLYRAVVHGCLAGEYEKAGEEIYIKRIERHSNRYSQNKLRAYSESLVALSAFFSQSCLEFNSNDLPKRIQILLLDSISFCLKSLGRLKEASVTYEANLKLAENLQSWNKAAFLAGILAEILLILGSISKAEVIARKAVKYAQINMNKHIQRDSYSRLALVLNDSGQLDKTKEAFLQAKLLHQQVASSNSYLCLVQGCWYCSFLLNTARDTNDIKELVEKGIYGLKISQKNNLVLSIAFYHLILSQASIALNEFTQARNYLFQAMEGIQKANKTEYIPAFFLYRADFYLTQNQFDPALADLNSAWEIIERCDMNLYKVDYLLIHGRYCLATKNFGTVSDHYKEAKQLIEETGYHLRDAELDLFAAQICQQHGNVAGKNADFYLQKAKQRIEEIGQWGLLRIIERDFPEYSQSIIK